MGHIVDRSRDEPVRRAFAFLKEKLQRNQDAIPFRRGGSPEANLNPNARNIRVPSRIRRMINETFEKLGWSEAAFFLQTLGKLIEPGIGNVVTETIYIAPLIYAYRSEFVSH